MKGILLLASILILSVTVFAQPEAGTFSIKPKVGLNIAYFGESQSLTYLSPVSTSPRLGFAAGLEFEYQVRERVGLSAGAIYSQQGEKSSGLIAKVDYVNFPILANMYLAKGFAVKVGVQPGINVKAGYSE